MAIDRLFAVARRDGFRRHTSEARGLSGQMRKPL